MTTKCDLQKANEPSIKIETNPAQPVAIDVGTDFSKTSINKNQSSWKRGACKLTALVLLGCALFAGGVGAGIGIEANLLTTTTTTTTTTSTTKTNEPVDPREWLADDDPIEGPIELTLSEGDQTIMAAVERDESGSTKWHLVLHPYGGTHYEHLVYVGSAHGGTTFRFTSLEGSYTPNDTAECRVDISDDAPANAVPAQVTLSQLGERLVGTLAQGELAIVGATPLPGNGFDFFSGCLPNYAAEEKPAEEEDQSPLAVPDDADKNGTAHRSLSARETRSAATLGSDASSLSWPVLSHQYCNRHDGGRWRYYRGGESEAKAACMADAGCSGIVQYTQCCGGRYYFTCSASWDGTSVYSWWPVRMHKKPAIEPADAVPGDGRRATRAGAARGLTSFDSISAARQSASANAHVMGSAGDGSGGRATDFSPEAAPTVGWLGPYLVVRVTYNGHQPFMSQAQIHNEFFGSTGFAAMVAEASWGQYKLRPADVDYIEIEADADPLHWNIANTYDSVNGHQAVVAQKARRSYTRVLAFEPNQPACGDCFAGTAYVPGDFSRYRGDGGQDWQTIAHELGHNNDLGHSGSCRYGSHHQYAGYSMMSWFAGEHVKFDPNAPNRYRLGWMGDESVVTASTNTAVHLSALNLGPATGRKLMLRIPCPSCVSANSGGALADGFVYVSFRGHEAGGSNYGVEDGFASTEFSGGRCTNNRIDRLRNEVHVHYQRDGSHVWGGSKMSELWTSLPKGGSYHLHGSTLHIHVCETTDESGATVTLADSSDAALRLCGSAKRATLHGNTYARCQGTYQESPDVVNGRTVWDRVGDASRFIFWCGGKWRITGSQWRADFVSGRIRHCGSFISSDNGANEWYDASWGVATGTTSRKAVLTGSTYAGCEGTYREATDEVNGKKVWDRIASTAPQSHGRFVFWCGGKWRITGSQWRADFVSGRIKHCGSFISSDNGANEWFDAKWGSQLGLAAHLAIE